MEGFPEEAASKPKPEEGICWETAPGARHIQSPQSCQCWGAVSCGKAGRPEKQKGPSLS